MKQIKVENYCEEKYDKFIGKHLWESICKELYHKQGVIT